MLSEGFESVHLTFIQRFEFPEPVFFPKSFRKSGSILKKNEYEFLSNPDLMNKMIGSMKEKNLPGIGKIKPIKNIETQKDNFWEYFAYKKFGRKLTKGTQRPYYPFQVIPYELGLKENRNQIQEITGMEIVDSKLDTQMRLFPCGIGTVHLYLYLKPKKLDADKLLKLTSDPRNIRISSQKGWEKNTLGFFNDFVNMVLNRICYKRLHQNIYGYFLLFNFQGKGFKTLSSENIEDFAKILKNNPYSQDKDKYKEIIERKNLDRSVNNTDYIFISPKTAILFIDEGIRNIGHERILKGRRCFRSHFLNILEMVYNIEWLLKYYNEYLIEKLSELETAEIQNSPVDELRKLINSNIFEDHIYKTLKYGILRIPEKLGYREKFYAQIFEHTATTMNLKRSATELKDNMDMLYEKASEWDVQMKFLGGFYREMKWWINAFLSKK